MLQNSQVERFEEVALTVEDDDSTLNLSLPEDPQPISPSSTHSLSPSFGNNVSSPNQNIERSATPSPNLLWQIGPNDQQQLGYGGSSTASPNSERQLSTASPEIQGHLHTPSPDKTKLKTENWEKWTPISSPSSDSDVSHDDQELLNTTVPHTEPQIDSSPNKEHQIGTPSPVNLDHDQFSALSPDIEWDVPSPNIERQAPSPDNWRMFNPVSPDTEDKSSSPRNQRQRATPSPMLVDHRQLITPSPMSVSSEEYDRNDSTSHTSESNKPALYPSTSGSKTLTSSITISKPKVDSNVNSNFGMKLADDSGFGSATVSPSVDPIKTSLNSTINLSSSSSPESAAEDSKTSKYNGKDVIDLTSPKKNKSSIRETFYFGGLTDEIAETMTASEIEAALSGHSNPTLTSVKNPDDSVSIIPESYSSSISAKKLTTNASGVIAHSSFDVSRHSSLLSSKGSAPSTSNCACNNCKQNGSTLKHSKTGHLGTCSRGKKSTAPATISRPPASPPGDATNSQPVSVLGSSAYSSTYNLALPLSTNAKPFKDNTSTLLHTCEKYSGAYETFPNIENGLNSNTIGSATSLSGSKQKHKAASTSQDPDIRSAKTVGINKAEGIDIENPALGKLAKTAVETKQKQEDKEKDRSIAELVDFLRLVFNIMKCP